MCHRYTGEEATIKPADLPPYETLADLLIECAWSEDRVRLASKKGGDAHCLANYFMHVTNLAGDESEMRGSLAKKLCIMVGTPSPGKLQMSPATKLAVDAIEDAPPAAADAAAGSPLRRPMPANFVTPLKADKQAGSSSSGGILDEPMLVPPPILNA